MKYHLDLSLLSDEIVIFTMTDKAQISPCHHRVKRYGKLKNSIGSARKKNNSFSGNQTPEKGCNSSVNYYSDNASSYVQSSAKKYRSRRSLSSSPTLFSHYAGAKFSEPPSPSVLPLPPAHWTECESTPSTPRSPSPVDFEILEQSCMSTPISKIATPSVNQSVELFFQKCSFSQLETCIGFTKQLKTLLNVPA